MKILSADQLRRLDIATISNQGIASHDLMERAAQRCVDWLTDHFDRPTRFVILAGPGNNGGDGLVIARLLNDISCEVLVFKADSVSKDNKLNSNRLAGIKAHPIEDFENYESTDQDVLIDALFGYGITRNLDGLYATVTQKLNSLQNIVVSIDVPSGLIPDGPTNGPVVDADFTLTFQTPKLAFFIPENQEFSGEWIVLDIGLDKEHLALLPSNYQLVDETEIQNTLPQRMRFDHKGTYGHAMLVAGSFGKVGAAILSAQAALRSGVGLLTVHAPRQATNILQIAVPEAMVSADRHDFNFSGIDTMPAISAMGVGCGLGLHGCTTAGVRDLLKEASAPMVIDADGLNTISASPELIQHIPERSILTPHLKEFARLFGESENHFARLELLREKAMEHGLVIVLKGAYTAVADLSGKVTFNTTGNPGMATAGSGDVLTGVITALLAQGMSPSSAARAGVYIHGLAGDLAVKTRGNEALIASDIIDHLGNAFQCVRQV